MILKKIGAKFDGSCTNIINKLPDTDNKILFFKEKIFKDKLEQRQFALEQCTGDWVFIVDADEFYKKNHLKKLRLKIDEVFDTCNMILFPHLNFFDFEHYNKKNYMERVYKNNKGNIGYWGNDKDGQNIYTKDVGKMWDQIDFIKGGKSEFLFTDDVRCYHYSKMKDWDSMLLRGKYYISRGNKPLTEEKLDYIARKWIREHIICAKLNEMTLHNIADHPEIIKEHPLYKKYNELKNLKHTNDFMTYVMGIKNEKF